MSEDVPGWCGDAPTWGVHSGDPCEFCGKSSEEIRSDMLTEVRFWALVTANAKQTVICNPEFESRIKSWVASRGLAGIITVEAGRFVPMDRVFVIDEGAARFWA